MTDNDDNLKDAIGSNSSESEQPTASNTETPSPPRRRRGMPEGFMEVWRKKAIEEGRWLPPGHPVYSEPPTIMFLSRKPSASPKTQEEPDEKDEPLDK